MQVLRQILNIESRSLNIKLPDDFKAKEVEVIIFPLDESQTTKTCIADLRGKLHLTDAQYIEFQEEVKKSREEWEKNI